MPPDKSYAKFCDDFLVAVAEAQAGENVEPVEAEQFCAKNFPAAMPTCVMSVTETLSRIGVGRDLSTDSSSTFLINGHGLLMADKIREANRPKTYLDKLKSINRSDWIAFGAFFSIFNSTV